MADTFMAITGASASVAARYLSAAGGNVELAVSNFFDAPPPAAANEDEMVPMREEEPPPPQQQRGERAPAAARIMAPMPHPMPVPMPVPVVPPPPPPVEVVPVAGPARPAVLQASSVECRLCDLNVETTWRATFVANEPMEALFRYRSEASFTCFGYEVQLGGRTLRGVAQEKRKAADTYDDAMSMGSAAVLAQQTGSAFELKLGLLPANQPCTITFSFVTEASVDEETLEALVDVPLVSVVPPGDDGVRFTLTVRGGAEHVTARSEHPIEIARQDDVLVATLGKTQLRRELQLAVRFRDPGLPFPLVESDGAEPLAVQIMFTPRVDLDADKGEEVATEVVVLVDRSGSMAGGRMRQTKAALQILLRSLPSTTLFNIVSFGTSVQSLFSTSQPLRQDTFETASRTVAEFQANLGGTDILTPLRSILQAPVNPNFPRQVVILTDGDVPDTPDVLALIRRATAATPTRVFSLGIGMDASQELIRGIAKEGHGSFEFVRGEMRIEPTMARIVQRVLRPVIQSVRVDWGSLKPERVTPLAHPTVFSGQKVTSIALLTAHDGGKHNVTLHCTLSGGIERSYIASVDLATQKPGKMVHRLAAKSLVEDLVQHGAAKTGLTEKGVVAMACRYGIASQLTSIVAVDGEANDTFVAGGPVPVVDGAQNAQDNHGADHVDQLIIRDSNRDYRMVNNADDLEQMLDDLSDLSASAHSISEEVSMQNAQLDAMLGSTDDMERRDQVEFIQPAQAQQQRPGFFARMFGQPSASGAPAGGRGAMPAAPVASYAPVAAPPLRKSEGEAQSFASLAASAKTALLSSKLGSRKKERSASVEDDADSAAWDEDENGGKAGRAEREQDKKRILHKEEEEEKVAVVEKKAAEAEVRLEAKEKRISPRSSKLAYAPAKPSPMSPPPPPAAAGPMSSSAVKLDAGSRPLDHLTVLQRFDGSFALDASLAAAVGVSLAVLAAPDGLDANVWATLVAMAVLEARFADARGEWALLAKRARLFVVKSKAGDVDALMDRAKALVASL